MNYDFSNMKGKTGELYRNMWGKTDFGPDDIITNKNWTGNKSKDSFFIKTPETTKVFEQIIPALAQDLCNAFELKNREHFVEKLSQACGGSGQEVMKIATMHSSSLCALLFFYNVSDNNKLIIKLCNGKTYEFNQSLFEFQNVVIEGGLPSNIDVVLVGRESVDGNTDDATPVVLFLESKFSEYYTHRSSYIDISNAYLNNVYGKEIYELLEGTGKYTIAKQSGNNFRLNVAKLKQEDNGATPKAKKKHKNTPKTEYIHGVKQMISHYIGVCNLINEADIYDKATAVGVCKEREKVLEMIKNNATVLLGSIVFDDLFKGSVNQFYTDYEEKYKVLTNILQNVTKGKFKQLTVLKEPLTYTQVFNQDSKGGFMLDKKVEDYYLGKAKATTSVTPA